MSLGMSLQDIRKNDVSLCLNLVKNTVSLLIADEDNFDKKSHIYVRALDQLSLGRWSLEHLDVNSLDQLPTESGYNIKLEGSHIRFEKHKGRHCVLPQPPRMQYVHEFIVFHTPKRYSVALPVLTLANLDFD